MELHRFFTNGNLAVGQSATIDGTEARHIIKVLRLKVNFSLIVCNGDGYDYYAHIVETGKDNVRILIDERKENATVSPVKIHLYQCVAKADKFAFIVQKAVELGVSSITPVISAYSNPNELNAERLERVITEAAKQCGASALPVLNAPVKLDGIEFDIPVYMGYEHEDKVSLSDIDVDCKEFALLIGSEGGFSAQEADALRKKGVKTFSLGRRILRVETAAVALISLLTYKAGGLRL